MDLPDIVDSALDAGESVRTRVPLGGEDALFVTERRSLVYRSEGLLSDESVEEYSHGAERVSVSEGRRSSQIHLDYGLDGERTLKLPDDRIDDALRYIMAGVLDAAGLLADDEEVTHVFRFSELSLIVTTQRLVKHIGSPVWDDDAEQFRYADVTDLDFEEGSVATSVVLTLDDRQERFKAPNEQARAVREGLTSALLEYHGADSLEELRARTAEDDDAVDDSEDHFDEGIDPLGREVADPSPEAVEGGRTGERPTDEATATDGSEAGFEGSGFEAAGPVDGGDVAEEVAALREAVERQNERLERQQETLERLVEELRRGR